MKRQVPKMSSLNKLSITNLGVVQLLHGLRRCQREGCEILAEFNSLPKFTFREMKKPPQPLPCFPDFSTPHTPCADQSNLPRSAQHQRHRIARIPGEPEDGIAAQQVQKGCFCEHEYQIPTKKSMKIDVVYIYIYV